MCPTLMRLPWGFQHAGKNAANIQIFLNKSYVFHKFNTFTRLVKDILAGIGSKSGIFAVKIGVRCEHNATLYKPIFKLKCNENETVHLDGSRCCGAGFLFAENRLSGV